MNKYRIIRYNSRFGWQYKIQYKYFGWLWLDTHKQAYNRFDLNRVIEIMEEEIKRKKDFAERQKIGNSVL